jgi:cytochrome c oxidase subunit IV
MPWSGAALFMWPRRLMLVRQTVLGTKQAVIFHFAGECLYVPVCKGVLIPPYFLLQFDMLTTVEADEVVFLLLQNVCVAVCVYGGAGLSIDL